MVVFMHAADSSYLVYLWSMCMKRERGPAVSQKSGWKVVGARFRRLLVCP